MDLFGVPAAFPDQAAAQTHALAFRCIVETKNMTVEDAWTWVQSCLHPPSQLTPERRPRAENAVLPAAFALF